MSKLPNDLRIQEHTDKSGQFIRGIFKTENRKELNITIWETALLSQIEVWTTNGKSFVVKNEDAKTFATWIRDNFVTPLLGPIHISDPLKEHLADKLTAAIEQNQGKGVPMREVILANL